MPFLLYNVHYMFDPSKSFYRPSNSRRNVHKVTLWNALRLGVIFLK
jgi:hypothetical protein